MSMKIPEGWREVKLGDVSILKRGTPISKNEIKKGNIPVIASGIKPAYFNDKFNRNGEFVTIASSGTAGYVNFFIGKFFVSDAFTVEGKKDFANTKFLFYFLKNIQNKIYSLQTGGAHKHIYIKDIEKIKFFLPPLSKQKKIASILSTVDQKIDLIDRQIEEHVLLKKGLMQKLFTEGIGHSEFRDSEIGRIPVEWTIVRLKEVCKINMGQSPKSETYNEEKIGIPLIQGNTDIKNRKIFSRFFTTQPTKTCKIGDIIMTVRAPVGTIAKSNHNACIGRGVCSITSNEKNDFLYYFLVAYENKWDKLSQGSTFTAVNGNDIKNIKLPYPPLNEQKKIAEILSTTDEKLENLKAQKESFEKLKKGLTQKLLTGDFNGFIYNR